MIPENELSQITANAREDLCGNIEGEFSPEDWEKILARAHDLLRSSEKTWVDVIRDFHRERYWGFKPNYKRPKPNPHEENLGKRFIWYSFRSFLVTKVAVLYFGARWSADFDPVYGWLFFASIAFMLGNYGLFLWRYGRRPED
jgi:hypothetical protein